MKSVSVDHDIPAKDFLKRYVHLSLQLHVFASLAEKLHLDQGVHILYTSMGGHRNRFMYRNKISTVFQLLFLFKLLRAFFKIASKSWKRICHYYKLTSFNVCYEFKKQLNHEIDFNNIRNFYTTAIFKCFSQTREYRKESLKMLQFLKLAERLF